MADHPGPGGQTRHRSEPELAKVEPAEEHTKARIMIDTLIRSASPIDTTDVQAAPAKVAGGRTRRRRLWLLLHAQALLSGPYSQADFVEDDRRRMCGGRAQW